MFVLPSLPVEKMHPSYRKNTIPYNAIFCIHQLSAYFIDSTTGFRYPPTWNQEESTENFDPPNFTWRMGSLYKKKGCSNIYSAFNCIHRRHTLYTKKNRDVRSFKWNLESGIWIEDKEKEKVKARVDSYKKRINRYREDI